MHDRLRDALEAAAETLRARGFSPTYAHRLELLAAQLSEPCVLAIVGRAKAGKSTFVNTLLGEDLAKVGVTETTTTTNYFRYGVPADETRPVRCYFRDGRYENVPRSFVDELQSYTDEAIQRAASIDYLEYYVPNPMLRHITLVDTPGMQAAVDAHGDETNAVLLQSLRQHHDAASRRHAAQADAVVYLVGSVARSDDRYFLQEFGQATGAAMAAFNAVGVLSKVDISSELLERRTELAQRIAEQLADVVTTVVPVSAALQQLLLALLDDEQGYLRELSTLRSACERQLTRMLDIEDLFCDQEVDGFPLSVEQRRRLRGQWPWAVFTLAVRTIAQSPDDETAVRRLKELAGFDQLMHVLETHFFRRAQLLRSYRVVREAVGVLNDLRRTEWHARLQQASRNRARADRFLDFLRAVKAYDPARAEELMDYVQETLAGEQVRELQQEIDTIERNLSVMLHELQLIGVDVSLLNSMADYASALTDEEERELRRLFGCQGLDWADRLGEQTEAFIEARLRHWMRASLKARRPERREIAAHASRRYQHAIQWLRSQR